MSQSGRDSAEQRFRASFERLRAGRPERLPKGALVSQNNVAKEAGADPSALRKSRYPELIREIQAFVEIANQQETIDRRRREKRRRRSESLQEKVKVLRRQRDQAQSQLSSAHRQVLELLRENRVLEGRLAALDPPPTPIRR